MSGAAHPARAATLAVVGALALASCTAAAPDAVPEGSAASSASPSPSARHSAQEASAQIEEPETLAWGPTVDAWEEALADAAGLTVREAAGAVLMPAYSGADAAEAAALVEDGGLSGVMLMGDATSSAGTVTDLTAALQAAADSRGWPALIAVDQEGGPVARLDGVLPSLPAFIAAGAAADKSLVRSAYAGVGADLDELGFTIDFAPVADVTIGLGDPVIRQRSAGDDAQDVAGTVVASMLGYLDGGVVPAVKHFPGHGAVTTDSHDAVPTLSGSLEELEAEELVPFRRAVAVGAPMIMMGHIAVEAWGALPASVDPEAYAYLRDELGFTGVAVTDALNMGAITESYAPGEAAVAALAAGADLLLMPVSVDAARDAIVEAVDSGELSRERLDEAAARVILLARWQDELSADGSAAEADYAEALALGSVTVGAADCSAPLVGDTVTISGGFEADRVTLAAAFETYGVSVGEGGTSVRITGADDAAVVADVVVAMGGPWALASSDARVYVGAYGRGEATLSAVAAVLAGDQEPQGEWPVALPGVPDAC